VVVFGYLEGIDVSLVDPVVPGDLVLVHAGVALTTLDPDAASDHRVTS
jgi:hydrogenase maturation factor